MRLLSLFFQKPDNQSAYQYDIQSLRAVAVIFVVLYHAFPSVVGNGYIGVDVFFIISGYLVTKNFIEKNYKGIKAINFYSKRLLRLYPALIFTIIVVYSLGYILLFPEELIQLAKSIIPSILFWSNIYNANQSGYFDVSSKLQPFTHMWSLAVEVHFYFLLPLILYFYKQRKLFLFIIGGILMASLSYQLFLFLGKQNETSAYYNTFGRLWQPLLGSLTYLIKDNFKNKINRLFLVLSLILLSLIPRNFFELLGPIFLIIPSLVTALFISNKNGNSYTEYEKIIRIIINMRIIQYLGSLSYPLYLIHFPILSLAWISGGDRVTYKVEILLIFIALLFSIFTFEVVEKRFNLIISVFKRVFYVVLFIAIILCASVITTSYQGWPNRSLEGNKVSVFSDLNTYVDIDDHCMETFLLTEVDVAWDFCRYTSSNPKVLLIGDSYANALFSGLADTTKFAGLGLVHYGACDPALNDSGNLIYLERVGIQHPCYGDNFETYLLNLNFLIENQNFEKIIYVISIRTLDRGQINLIADFFDGLDFNIDLTVVMPLLRLDYDPVNCIQRPLLFFNPKTCITSFDPILDENNFREFQSVFSSYNLQAHFFNPNLAFCELDECVFMNEGIPVFRDSAGHLNQRGALVVARHLEEFLEW